METSRLTSSEGNALRFIVFYHKRHGTFPRNKEISENIGLNKASISMLVSTLEEKGYIFRENHQITGISKGTLTILKNDLVMQLESIIPMLEAYGVKKVETNGTVTFTKDGFSYLYPGAEGNTVLENDTAYKFRYEEKKQKPIPTPKAGSTPDAVLEAEKPKRSGFRELFRRITADGKK